MNNGDKSASPVIEHTSALAMKQAEGFGMHVEPYTAHLGLTKREHFAAMAMQGILANIEEKDFSLVDAAAYIGVETEDYDWRVHYPMLAAKKAVANADALLKALENNNAD